MTKPPALCASSVSPASAEERGPRRLPEADVSTVDTNTLIAYIHLAYHMFHAIYQKQLPAQSKEVRRAVRRFRELVQALEAVEHAKTDDHNRDANSH